MDRLPNPPLPEKQVPDSPLARERRTLAGREIIARYTTEVAAASARIALIEAGVAHSAISITAPATDSEAVLAVTPAREQSEIIVRILAYTSPTHFDADLERWRNLA